MVQMQQSFGIESNLITYSLYYWAKTRSLQVLSSSPRLKIMHQNIEILQISTILSPSNEFYIRPIRLIASCPQPSSFLLSIHSSLIYFILFFLLYFFLYINIYIYMEKTSSWSFGSFLSHLWPCM